MQQKFIFSITHSIHTLQPINIPCDYRFSFCFRIFLKLIIISKCEPHSLLGRAEPPTKFSKSESLVGFHFLEEVCCKSGGDLFKGVEVFT